METKYKLYFFTFISFLFLSFTRNTKNIEYQKYIRTICVFSADPSKLDIDKLYSLKNKLEGRGYIVQTLRMVSEKKEIKKFERTISDTSIMLGIGTISFEKALDIQQLFYDSRVSMNIDLTKVLIEMKHVEFIFDLINNAPGKMFDFAYVFNNADNSPFFPAANYNRKGFSIGLQSPNLANNASSLDEWLNRKKSVWGEINQILKDDDDFLGIDASTAPLYRGDGSLIGFIENLGYNFIESTTTDVWTRITNFINDENLNSIGLNGLMLPCLEDFELADEYEKGNFSIERNIFLSLQSGLGIDTYPIGINENPKRVLNILKIVQSLSNKYNKPLSIRFVSDGKSKIGEKTSFNNKYLKDVMIRKL